MREEYAYDSDPIDPIRQVTETVSIDAPADQVWAIVIDVNRMPGVHPKMVSARWLDGASQAGLGVRFTSENVHEEFGIWHATSTVVHFQPTHSVAWTIEGDGAPPTVCRFDLVSEPNLGSNQVRTLLRQTYFYDTRPGASPPVEQALVHCH